MQSSVNQHRKHFFFLMHVGDFIVHDSSIHVIFCIKMFFAQNIMTFFISETACFPTDVMNPSYFSDPVLEHNAYFSQSNPINSVLILQYFSFNILFYLLKKKKVSKAIYNLWENKIFGSKYGYECLASFLTARHCFIDFHVFKNGK